MNDPYDNTQFFLEEPKRQLTWLKEQLKKQEAIPET